MLLAISGQKNSGKDTAADLLTNKYSFVKIAFADIIKRQVQELFDFSYDQLWGDSKNRDIPDIRFPVVCKPCQGNGWFLVNNYGEYGDLLDTKPEKRTHAPCNGTGILSYVKPRDPIKEFGDAGRKYYPNIYVDYTLNIANKILNEGQGYSPDKGLNRFGWGGEFVPAGIIVSDARFKNEMDCVKKEGGKNIRIKRGKTNTNADSHISESEQLSIPDNYFDYIIDNNGSLEELEISVNNCLKTLCIT